MSSTCTLAPSVALLPAVPDRIAGHDQGQRLAEQVHALLQGMDDPGAGMKKVAAALQMTDRTLRRRLAREGTCFSEISHSVRYGVAARHLRGSDSRIEDIAELSGFSDPANFRRAFIRWTRMSPAQFRRMQHG